MPEIPNENRKAELALARSSTVTDWAHDHDVPVKMSRPPACPQVAWYNRCDQQSPRRGVAKTCCEVL
jgi:hypothetical protein